MKSFCALVGVLVKNVCGKQKIIIPIKAVRLKLLTNFSVIILKNNLETNWFFCLKKNRLWWNSSCHDVVFRIASLSWHGAALWSRKLYAKQLMFINHFLSRIFFKLCSPNLCNDLLYHCNKQWQHSERKSLDYLRRPLSIQMLWIWSKRSLIDNFAPNQSSRFHRIHCEQGSF